MFLDQRERLSVVVNNFTSAMIMLCCFVLLIFRVVDDVQNYQPLPEPLRAYQKRFDGEEYQAIH